MFNQSQIESCIQRECTQLVIHERSAFTHATFATVTALKQILCTIVSMLPQTRLFPLKDHLIKLLSPVIPPLQQSILHHQAINIKNSYPAKSSTRYPKVHMQSALKWYRARFALTGHLHSSLTYLLVYLLIKFNLKMIKVEGRKIIRYNVCHRMNEYSNAANSKNVAYVEKFPDLCICFHAVNSFVCLHKQSDKMKYARIINCTLPIAYC